MTQPSSNPLSTMADSMLLMVTAGSLMPRTQEPSHGAGQTRPVNSGKLLVLWRRFERFAPQAAVDQVVPLGMRLLMGSRKAMPSSRVPVWQKGTPQSMQRAPCWRRSDSSACSWNSCQSATRSAGRARLRQLAGYFQESGGLAHALP